MSADASDRPLTHAPLTGCSVVVTRAADQASNLASQLADLGATVVYAPTIRFEAVPFQLPDDLAWIVVTSPNGVAALTGRDIGAAQVAVVGPGTADAAVRAGFRVALTPPRSLAESLVAHFPASETLAQVAIVQADIARPTMVDGLRAKGWSVSAITAYRTLPVDADPVVRAAIVDADAITFTSGSTVRSFVAAYGTDALADMVISIGPVTSQTCAELGVRVTSEAYDHDVAGLVKAVVAAFGSGRSGETRYPRRS